MKHNDQMQSQIQAEIRDQIRDQVRAKVPAKAEPSGEPNHKRSSQRYGVLRSAHILSGKQEFCAECVVRDISKTGARILVDFPEKIPGMLILELKQNNARHTCEVIWRTEFEVGLQFIA